MYSLSHYYYDYYNCKKKHFIPYKYKYVSKKYANGVIDTYLNNKFNTNKK